MTKRALILAGGGLKVAFQAGVMQVWLDEAGLSFDLADGASGGCFNLAMLAQGQTGKQIADNWRRFQPFSGLDARLPDLAKLGFSRSLFTLDAYRTRVFPDWGLDFAKICASRLGATFNYWNFSKTRLEIVEPAAMTEDKLVACVSLPMWFPPVVIDGDTCIDAVFNTDANLEEAIRRGADELWIIWTVSEAGRWTDGFINNYFQIIEVAANGRLRDVLKRIEANNADLAAGRAGEFGRPIVVKMLSAEVDLNYIVDFRADRFTEAVNAGVAKARAWCAAQNIAFNSLPDADGPAAVAPVTLSFSEVMKGFVEPGEVDFDVGFRKGSSDGAALTARLTIATDDVNRFLTHPQHEAAVTGVIVSERFGGQRPIASGAFNLLVDTDDPSRKLMTYRLVFSDADGAPLTLVGFKDVRSGEGHDPWTTTTTLFTRILKGAVKPEDDPKATIVATGIISIHMLDFLEELTTFRTIGADDAARIGALARFWGAISRQALGGLRFEDFAGRAFLSTPHLSARAFTWVVFARPSKPLDACGGYEVFVIAAFYLQMYMIILSHIDVSFARVANWPPVCYYHTHDKHTKQHLGSQRPSSIPASGLFSKRRQRKLTPASATSCDASPSKPPKSKCSTGLSSPYRPRTGKRSKLGSSNPLRRFRRLPSSRAESRRGKGEEWR